MRTLHDYKLPSLNVHKALVQKDYEHSGSGIQSSEGRDTIAQNGNCLLDKEILNYQKIFKSAF